VLGLLSYAENIKNSTLYLLLAGMGVYFFSRLYFYYYRVGFFLWKNLKNLRQIINEFKKGKFVLSDTDIQSNDNISQVLRELLTVGEQFDSIVSSQSDELKKFHEIYSHIICSINSHFIIIDKSEKILYANESFCKKFNVEGDKVTGKGLSSVFYFVNTRLKIAINKIIKDRDSDSIYVKNVHLMSVSRKR
jgi:transcriptional regulator with PAS, ATPase and Fis domain